MTPSESRYLVDTNGLRKIVDADDQATAHIEAIDDADIFLSVIAVREYLNGIFATITRTETHDAKAPGKLPWAYDFLDDFLEVVANYQIHPYTEEADALYRSWKKGIKPGKNDWRIAASAVEADMVVITADTGFQIIANSVSKLKYEDFGTEPESSS